MVRWFCAAKCQILTASTKTLAELSSNCGFCHETEKGAHWARRPSAIQGQNMEALNLLFICLVPLCHCCFVNAGQTTYKQRNNFNNNNKKSPFQTNINKKSSHNKTKTEHSESLYRAIDKLSLSVLCLSQGFGSVFQSVALSADPGSVSQQRLPHHQRLQRGGGGWANVSQGLLRSPSTEKYTGEGGMEVMPFLAPHPPLLVLPRGPWCSNTGLSVRGEEDYIANV